MVHVLRSEQPTYSLRIPCCACKQPPSFSERAVTDKSVFSDLEETNIVILGISKAGPRCPSGTLQGALFA